MCRIEVKCIKQENYNHMENTCNYVARADRCQKGYIGATNAWLPTDRSYMASAILDQMKRVHAFYQQEETRLGLHVCLAFAPSECKYLNRMNILNLGYALAMQEFPDCITYFAVHDHSEHLHLDMMIDAVLIHSGKKFGCGSGGWRGIGYRVHEMMKCWVPEEAISDLQVSFDDKNQ